VNGPRQDDGAPAAARRGAWIIGLVSVVFLVYVAYNTFTTESVGSRGVAPGADLPPFAVPLATSGLDGAFANVATRPDQGDQIGNTPACAVRGPQVLNVCALAERGPVVLAFLATRAADCAGALDVMEAARRRHPGVQFAAVSLGGEIQDTAELVRANGWSFPVGWDQDGVLASLYSVAVCPQVTFAAFGGEVQGTAIGQLDPVDFERRLERLERRSIGLGWEGGGS
jgi:hypothetical protein